MAIPRQSVNLSSKEFKAIFKTVISGKIFFGPEISNFESQFAKYIGVKHALAVSSGRAAEYIALKSLNLPLESEIIIPAYTFYVVPVVAKLAGLKPIFVDARSDTYNLNTKEVEEKITSKTKCIIATHIAGQPCDIDKIMQIARKHNLYVIEDCAHACGSEYKGAKAGSFGDISYFSFNVSKNMTCLGGGILVTNDDKIFKRMQEVASAYKIIDRLNLLKSIIFALTTYIFSRSFIFTWSVYPLVYLCNMLNLDWISGIFREDQAKTATVSDLCIAKMSNLQAKVGIEQLKRVENLNFQRIKNSIILQDALKDCQKIRMQQIIPEVKSTYLYFYLYSPESEKIRKKLALSGIDTREDMLSACPTLDMFKGLNQDCAVTKQLVKDNIQLPNFPALKDKEILKVISKIKDILEEKNT